MKRPELVPAGGTAVVTGAAGGMGEHIAKGLARRGADLVILDRDAAGLERVARDVGRETPGAHVTTLVVDLADRAAADEAIARIRDGHPGVTMLFNNAGVAVGGRFGQVSAEDFDWLLEINLLVPIRLTRALLPAMLENGEGQVVNTSSLFGLVGPPGQSAYCTSKYGLRGFSESLRSELDAEQQPVGVTVVHPGGIRTNIATHARVAAGVDATRPSATVGPSTRCSSTRRTRRPRRSSRPWSPVGPGCSSATTPRHWTSSPGSPRRGTGRSWGGRWPSPRRRSSPASLAAGWCGTDVRMGS